MWTSWLYFLIGNKNIYKLYFGHVTFFDVHSDLCYTWQAAANTLWEHKYIIQICAKFLN